MYRRIIFMQGSDAEEPLEILDRDGNEAALEYLVQWELQAIDGEEWEKSASGESDVVYESDDGYRLCWNYRLSYIGLEHVIN